MTLLADEVRNVQNPALGALLIWRFVCGYVETQKVKNAPPLQLAFLVLPILLHAETERFVQSTQRGSGLRTFAAKFGEAKTSKQDLLLAIHDRARRLSKLTFAALQVASSSLLVQLTREGCLVPLSHTSPTSGLSDETRQLMRNAEKLGSWCAQLTLHEVATCLKVRF